MNTQYIGNGFFNFSISFLYTLCIAIVFFELNSNTIVVSMLFSITFIILFMMWIASLSKFVTKKDKLVMAIAIIAFFNTLLSSINYSETSFEYFKPFVLFLCTLIYFSFINKIRICNNVKKYILYLNLFLSIYVIYYFETHQSEVFEFNNIHVDYLVLNMDNPNKAALFLSCLFFNLSIFLFESKNKYFRLILLANIAMIVYMTSLTEARNAMLAIGLFIVTMVLNRRLKNIPQWGLIIIAIFPFLFAGIYMLFINVAMTSGYFDFLISEGKGLDSRMIIWKEGFEGFFAHPILGAYYQIQRVFSYASLHNTHLHVLVAYGIVPFLLFLKFLYSILKNSKFSNGDILQQAGFIAFAAILFLGCGEASMVLGTQGIYILQGSILLLTASNRN